MGRPNQNFVTYNNVSHYILQNRDHTARMRRRQVKHFPTFLKNIIILEFHDHILNHHEISIQISIDMPGIGSLIRGEKKK